MASFCWFWPRRRSPSPREVLSKEQVIEALRQKVQATAPPPEAKWIETVAQFTLRIRGRETCSFVEIDIDVRSTRGSF